MAGTAVTKFFDDTESSRPVEGVGFHDPKTGVVTISFKADEVLSCLKESASGKSVGFSLKVPAFNVTLKQGDKAKTRPLSMGRGGITWVSIQ